MPAPGASSSRGPGLRNLSLIRGELTCATVREFNSCVVRDVMKKLATRLLSAGASSATARFQNRRLGKALRVTLWYEAGSPQRTLLEFDHAKSATCLCAVLGLGLGLCARAGVVDAPGGDLEVSLITYGPGAVYWERFGHDAIRIRDRVSGESADFNYGVFDFEDSAFLWNFARGHMRYMIDIQPSDLYQKDYIKAGRSVVAQRLALSTAQAVSLRAFLLWNLRPENVGYNYDYLTDNCATRVRDALNSALGGALKPPFPPGPRR